MEEFLAEFVSLICILAIFFALFFVSWFFRERFSSYRDVVDLDKKEVLDKIILKTFDRRANVPHLPPVYGRRKP